MNPYFQMTFKIGSSGPPFRQFRPYGFRMLAAAGVAAIGLTANAASADDISVSYGVDITSNYVSKGTTQTEDRPAVQPYIELSYRLFYVGLWASNVRFDGASDIEYDVYAGVTPTRGQVDFDIGFAQYFYRDDSADYGEAFVKADWAATDRVTFGLDYYREVYADQDWLYANFEIAGLPWELSLSGGVGTDFGSRDLGSDKYAMDIGMSRGLTDHSSADLRIYGGNYDDELIVFTLSFFN